MTGKQFPLCALSALIMRLLRGAAWSAGVNLEITNATHRIYFTPLLVTSCEGSMHLFEVGTTASADLRVMAEGGDTAGLLAGVVGGDDETVSNPIAGLLGSGKTATPDTAATGNNQLSIVAMLLPANDGCVGRDVLLDRAKSSDFPFRDIPIGK